MTTRQVSEFKETEIGKIPVDWKLQKISDLYEIRSGLSKPREEFGFGHPFLSFKEIFENFSLPDKLKNLVNSSEKERELGSIKKGDVFLTRTSETWDQLGMSSVALKDYKNATFNGFAKRLRPTDNKTILPEFAVFLFRSPKIQNQFSMHSNLTTRASLSGESMKHVLLTIPTIKEQKKISKTLSDLDSKIQNLQKQNKILEQTAQAIFKSWFVNFDGVTEFEDSEIDQIPKGWSVEKISDVCKIFGGGTPSTKNPDYWNGSNYWLVPSDLTSLNRIFCVDSERKITDEGLQNCASQIHPEKSIFMTSRATIGVFCINEIPAATNQGFIVSRPNNPNHLYYIFLNYLNRVDEFLQNANGSTFLEISRSNFRQLPILIPTPKILDDFHKEIKPFFDMLFDNEQMIELLTKTRDILLPKLMSGEIRI